VNVLAAVLLASTSLHITVWPNGATSMPKRAYTLACAPVGGTLPHRATACAKLAALKAPFTPTPPNTACTEIYSGPQQALVTGRFRGRSIRAHFSRKDGCETARWARVVFLFPRAVAAARSR
jgi:Subtilisin inhibitor-like